MYIDYMLFAVIALLTNTVILVRILCADRRYREKGFIFLIALAMGQNLIDLFWGLTYFDKIGAGAAGLEIASSLYFCSNAILAFAWFLFLHQLFRGNEMRRWVISLVGVPVALVILMVIANIHTGLLFTVGETVDSYARGSWYILERICTSGYLLVIFAWSVIRLLFAKEKSERKRYAIITTFALVPLVCDMMQVFFVAIPCTSIAFQITILIVYTFVSVAREDNIFLSASERQKNNLQIAMAQTAMSWYEFNIDKDHIYDGKIYIEKDLYVKRPEQVSESYSGYYQFLLSRVSPAYKEDYRNTFAVANLKKSFEQGKPECSLQYWITDSAGEDIYIYQNIILTRDHVTDELIGFAYTRDITAEERQKRAIEEQLSEITALNAELSNRIALIQSMSKVYFLSLYVNVVNDTF